MQNVLLFLVEINRIQAIACNQVGKIPFRFIYSSVSLIINFFASMKAHSILLIILLFAMGFSHQVQAQSFGGSLAMSDNTVFIGETGNAAFPGEVYVFTSMGDEWTSIQKIMLNTGKRGDRFGSALAFDGSHLIVGARASNNNAGGVFVYEKRDDTWVQVSEIKPDELSEGDEFGASIASSGDILAVSAPGAGKVYMYSKNSSAKAWEQAYVLSGSDSEEGDMFGSNLTLDDDLLLVSSPEHDSSKGAAYIYRYDETAQNWAEEAKLSSRKLRRRSGFGSSMIFFNGRAYIGAPNQDLRAGVVLTYSYDDESKNWIQNEELKAFDSTRFLRFGSSLAVRNNALWVGAPGFSRSQGAIYIHELGPNTSDTWASVVRLDGNDPGTRASFGASMLVHDELAVIGATGLDSRSGAAMVYQYSSEWEFQQKLINEMKSFPQITGEEVKCEDKKAGEFSCDNVDILSFMPIKEIGGKRGVRLNDIWGWKDQDTGKEYALIGRSNGTSFVDVTDPYLPIYIGDLPKTEGSRSNVWRDIKVYDNHAYIVADGAGNHGMQVFDLKQLRDLTELPVTFEATAHYDNIASAHNVVINESTGYAYIVGSSGGGETCGGGLHMVNIQNPVEPTFSGCFADSETGRRGTGYSHDAQCVIYQGPDVEHQGKEICFGSNETALSIADVSDKENPIAISMMSYPRVAYSHQGWLTEDHRYFYMNDEGDEVSGLVSNTRTLVWDVVDLDDPILVKEHLAETTAMDHNLYIKGNLMYQSNYDAGFRILDISDPENPVEVGFFDTTPFEGTGGGSWSNYPYFESGAVIVSSSYEGLFILKKGDVAF